MPNGIHMVGPTGATALVLEANTTVVDFQPRKVVALHSRWVDTDGNEYQTSEEFEALE